MFAYLKKFRLGLLALSFLLLSSLILQGCKTETPTKPLRLQGQIFGTYWLVTYLDPWTPQLSASLEKAIKEELNKVDLAMSTYKPNSELNQLNQAELGSWQQLSPDLFYILSLAQDISAASEGAFDVTLGGLVNLWNFGPEERQEKQPSQEEINQRLATAGYKYLELDPETLSARRMKDSFIDLSGIAKGFAVDKVAERIKNLGGENFMVNIGGEVYLAGQRAENRKWRLGVEIPSQHQQASQHLLELSNISVATSGDYRNFYTINDEEYSHTINPLTGWPVKHSLKSVTLLHSSNTVADAWATAFMVLGLEKGLEIANKNNLKALFISKTATGFNTQLSPSMQTYLGAEASAKLTLENN